MPLQSLLEDEDPIATSYPVYLTSPSSPSWISAAETSSDTAQRLLVLQYPAHRPAEIPYNARNLQKPSAIRVKPSTGLLELDVPIDTKLNYNPEKGSKYASSLDQSRVIKDGGTHGLSGGFNTGPPARAFREDEEIDMGTIPAYLNLPEKSTLSVQTLGGKIVKPSPGDPIYFLGSFQNNSLHLSHLDALVQVRPQLPHLDAGDELERSRGVAAATRAKGKEGGALNGDVPAAPPVAGPFARPESKAIDIKLKSSGPSSHINDLGTNANAKLLRAIQQEPWQTYEWIDEDEVESRQHAATALHLPLPAPENDTQPSQAPNLESAVSNSEWLDLMSAPRIDHGKKASDRGLMGKVRGRERERQRRKRNEAARKEKAAQEKATTTVEEETGGNGSQMAEDSAAMQRHDGTAADDTADDDEDGDDDDDDDEHRPGPSDEESSEDEAQGQRQAQQHDNGDVEMLHSPAPPTKDAIPQTDGPAEADSDEVMELHRPDDDSSAGTAYARPGAPAPASAPPAVRRRGRPRKMIIPVEDAVVDPIVVDD